MGLKETLRKLFSRQPEHQRKTRSTNGTFDFSHTRLPDGRVVVTFPGEKMDFSEAITGSNGRDLSNAYAQEAVRMGDVLEVTTEYAPANEKAQGRRLFYIQPDHALFGGMQGNHKFWPEKPYVGMPNVMIEEMITSWKKVGRIEPEEWNAMVAEIDQPH